MKKEIRNLTGLSAASSRREFIRKAATATVVMAGNNLISLSASAADKVTGNDIIVPWYRRVKRWGQTNITEKDPGQYDIEWWRKHWKTTQIQGVIVNAGGIVAYYPSQVPLHRQSKFLNGRDLFGDLCHELMKMDWQFLPGWIQTGRMRSSSTLTPTGLP